MYIRMASLGCGRGLRCRPPVADTGEGDEPEQRWLFLVRCQQRSLQEMTIYADQVEAMEEAGEDFFGHFS
jgi:hypothetical protein